MHIASELFFDMLDHFVFFPKNFFKAITDSLSLSLISNILAVSVALRSKVWFCCRPHAGNVGSNSAGGIISM